VVNLVGRLGDLRALLAIPGAHVHLYGKEARARRKLGHVTVVGRDEEERDTLLAEVEGVISA
jgi:5-(carboxyamino)imidazole ribonucleotide synthase